MSAASQLNSLPTSILSGFLGNGSEIEKVPMPPAFGASTGRLHATVDMPWVRVTASKT